MNERAEQQPEDDSGGGSSYGKGVPNGRGIFLLGVWKQVHDECRTSS
jgi:hypothetical protein